MQCTSIDSCNCLQCLSVIHGHCIALNFFNVHKWSSNFIGSGSLRANWISTCTDLNALDMALLQGIATRKWGFSGLLGLHQKERCQWQYAIRGSASRTHYATWVSLVRPQHDEHCCYSRSLCFPLFMAAHSLERPRGVRCMEIRVLHA